MFDPWNNDHLSTTTTLATSLCRSLFTGSTVYVLVKSADPDELICIYTVCKHSYKVPVAGGMKLRSVMEIPEKFRKLFSFPYFNIVQSRVFDDVLYTDKPLVLCSPTGSGKTAVFEIAIIRLLMTENINKNFKIVYMAPIKALCSERYQDWKDKLEPFGLRCMELTGDTDMDDFYVLQDVNVILTTPEKWDSMTRKWRDNQSVIQAICLFFIDEIHILNDPTRGATVEAVVTRMKTIQAARSRSNTDTTFRHLRFIAVSATITNIEDVAGWLGNTGSPAIYYKMDDSVRPVRLRKVVLGYYFADNKRSEFQFDMTLSYKLAGVINTYAENKPTLVFCSTRKGTQQAADILSRDVKGLYVKNAEHRQQLANCSYKLKDSKLRDLVCKGIAYHHAGLDLQDRKRVEESFQTGMLPVLVATSTLAMGVNLPAHLVIVKSTMYYNMGVHQEYSDIQILQMIGRAGRPQFDTSATAVIMTKNQTKMQYENLVNGTQLIESSLHKNLIEHLNAEIVLHTISDISVAVEWLKYTFLYIRVMKNPRYYGMPMGLTRDSIEKRLQDLCVKNLNQLHSLGLIQMDEETLDVKPTETGRLMARYCIAFKTTEQLLDINGTESISDLLSTITKCHEFADIQLRINEKKTLNTLNRDKNRLTIRYPMTGKMKTTDMKVNCLIQATFDCLLIQDFSLQQDVSRIFRAGIRVSRCLAEFLSQRNQYQSLLSALQLSKCFKAKLWEDSKYISKQLEGIGPTLSTALVNAGLTTFEKIEQTNPREIELIVNRHPPFGNQVRESVAALPRYELMIEQVTRYSIDSAEIIITVQLSNRDVLKDRPATYHTCTLLVGDTDNTVVYRQAIRDSQLLKDNSWSKKLDVRRARKGPELRINFISQDRVGLDVECTYTPNYLGGKIITNSTSISPKSAMPAHPPKPTPPFQQCNHACHDKQLCAHECCKMGVSSRRRPKPAQLTPKASSTCPVTSHVNDLRNRLVSLPQTPGMKRPKLQFSNDAPTNLDLSRYAYTPATLPGGDVSGSPSPDNLAGRPGVYYPTQREVNTGWDELELYQRHREQSIAEADQQYEGNVDQVPDLHQGQYQPTPTAGRNSANIQQQEEQMTELDFPGNYEDDFAQETDYGIMYVNGQDRSSMPATWEEHMEGDITGAKQQSIKLANQRQMYPTQKQYNQAVIQRLGRRGGSRTAGTKGSVYQRQRMPSRCDAELTDSYAGYDDEYTGVYNNESVTMRNDSNSNSAIRSDNTGVYNNNESNNSSICNDYAAGVYNNNVKMRRESNSNSAVDDNGSNNVRMRNDSYGNGTVGNTGMMDIHEATIEVYDSDGENGVVEGKHSKWMSFFSSQSSTGSDYLGEQYPVKHDGELVHMATHTSRMPLQGKMNVRGNENVGMAKQPLGQAENASGCYTNVIGGKMDIDGKENVGMPKSHLGQAGNGAARGNGCYINVVGGKMDIDGKKNVGMSKPHLDQAGNGAARQNSSYTTVARGNFGSANKQSRRNTVLSYNRERNNSIFGRKPPNSAGLKKSCENNLEELNDDFQSEKRANEQNHKYGQVLAWVSNSQGKSTGGKSESDWDEWSDEADMINGIEEQCKAANVATDGHSGLGFDRKPPSEKACNMTWTHLAAAASTEHGNMTEVPYKPVSKFTSFFGNNQAMLHDTSDNLSDIFEGIL